MAIEKGECSHNRNANMAEFDSSEIQEESARSQPHQTPNGPAAGNKSAAILWDRRVPAILWDRRVPAIPISTIHMFRGSCTKTDFSKRIPSLINECLGLEIPQNRSRFSFPAAGIEERINPKLLRAINLIGFKKILRMKEPIGRMILIGFTCGKNTMAGYVTFEKGECSRNRNANMAESDSSEIQEESPRSQPHQTPNGPAAEIEEQINPKLLRAIVNGNLIGFKKILRMKEPIDIESTGRVSLRGKNTALHVVVGLMKKSSSMEIFLEFMKKNSPPPFLLMVSPKAWSMHYVALVLHYLISLLIKPLQQPFLFVFSKKGIQKRIDAALGPKMVNMRWTRNAQSRKQKVNKLIEKAYDSFLNKRNMYMEIAKFIYSQDQTLLNARNNAKETPLHCAVKAGNLEMVYLLVKFAWEEGPQKLNEVLWARNQVGETALHEAARSGYSAVVKVLLGADKNLASSVDDNKISPLYLAVAAGCLDVVDMLIAPNLQPSYAGPDEQTALHAAVLTQEEYITWVILEWKYGQEQGISGKTDKAQNTPLHYATLIGNTYAVKQLLSKDTGSVYKKNLSGSYPVHLAAEAGNVKVIKELLTTCPDVGELLDKEERNFLHVAVQKKRIRVIMVAYKEGINANVINAKDKDGNTPLHLAVISSDSEIFALMCQNKRVNPHIRNDAGLTPRDLSASLKDHQFTYTLNPQSIIHRALETRGAFQNPCQPDLSEKVNNFWKARADRLNQREGKEMLNGGEVDIEKESTKYENMSKSLITGATLIASATFASIFTVSGLYRGDNTPHASIFTASGVYIGDNNPHTLSRRNFFKAFIIVNMAAFICAIVSTIWLLYSALSNFHLKYRKFYFKRCISLLHVAINLFILTFGLGGYIAIAPLSEWLALVILLVSGIAILWNIICSPKIIPLFFLVPYMSKEFQ